MNKLVVAALVKNEMDRFWPSALEQWQKFADHIVVLDDHSTDKTAELAADVGAAVYRRGGGVSAWGAEAPARAELWEHALAETEPGDFIFVLDADMVPLNDVRPFLNIKPSPGCVSFVLYDLWTPTAYRTDGPWQAHRHPRTWLVQRPEEEPEEGWLWPDRGIHTGHFPTNLYPSQPRLIAPVTHGLLHYGYSHPSLRERKATNYEDVAEQLTASEQQHALSILHPQPMLAELPQHPTYPLEMTPDEASDRVDHERS